jgi:hypothetical protein
MQLMRVLRFGYLIAALGPLLRIGRRPWRRLPALTANQGHVRSRPTVEWLEPLRLYYSTDAASVSLRIRFRLACTFSFTRKTIYR